MQKKTVVVLDSIRSAHNVGSIFRTCDGAGVSALYLCGYTPTPIDRFGRKRKDIEKVALGAEKTVPWKHFETTEDALEKLKNDKFTLIAVEQTEKSIPHILKESTSDRAFVFGNETEGLSESILTQCDLAVEIPMAGSKESLNVSVTVGIVLFANT